MAIRRLRSLAEVSGEVSVPTYVPSEHGAGIVHIGVGAFHRAHQAVYTDNALARHGGDWCITGISLRSTDVADALTPQNSLYSLLERGPDGTTARIIASLSGVIAAARNRSGALRALTAETTKIVTLTVTEKAYGIDGSSLTADPTHAAVAADLATPENPVGVLGMITESLRRRHQSGVAAYTVLCCDNLPDNGALVKSGVTDFARRIDPDLAHWIDRNVAFPSSMVDRITPATTQKTLDDAAQLIGCLDMAAVETEPFSQWVIEDRFSEDRPQWEAGGAIFVDNVKPYELAKLRMLNGAHSMLAYAGFLSGCTYVREVMAQAKLRRLVDRHMQAASATLPILAGFDIDQYRMSLLDRFSNPSIAHETYQIAMDGTEKLPQRILEPALETLDQGGNIRPFAFAVAAWMRYCLGKAEDNSLYALRDPRETEITAVLHRQTNAASICAALHRIPNLFDERLANHPKWKAAVEDVLSRMLIDGVASAIEKEV